MGCLYFSPKLFFFCWGGGGQVGAASILIKEGQKSSKPPSNTAPRQTTEWLKHRHSIFDKTNIRSMKRLLRLGACMFGLSPKPPKAHVFDSGHTVDFGITECQVWTMLQNQISMNCSDVVPISEKNTHHTVQSHIKRWIQISQESHISEVIWG